MRAEKQHKCVHHDTALYGQTKTMHYTALTILSGPTCHSISKILWKREKSNDTSTNAAEATHCVCNVEASRPGLINLYSRFLAENKITMQLCFCRKKHLHFLK